eukprot:scaffold144977_cov190-Phaeocystis_antarctica.AAC.1
MNGVCTRVPSPAPAVQPVPHERVVVGVELQAAELTAAGSGLAAEQRRTETERAREICLLQVLVGTPLSSSPIGFLAG